MTVMEIFAKKIENTLFIFFLLILFLAPFPLGANREWSWSLLQVSVFIIFAMWLGLFRYNQVRFSTAIKKARAVVILLALICTWQVFQLAPLPTFVVETLSPQAYAFHKAAYENLPSMLTLSVDPYASLQSFLKTCCYALLFSLTLLLVNSRQRLKALCYTLVSAGFIQACYASFNVLAHPHSKFELVATGSFVSRNHLAGFLELCLAVGIGLLIAQLSKHNNHNWKQHTRDFFTAMLSAKARLRIALAIMVVALVLTHSRMGNSAFFISLTITGCIALAISWIRLSRKRRSLRHSRRSRSLLVLLVSLFIIDVAIVGAWFGVDKVVERMEQTNLEKENRGIVVRDVQPMLTDFWLTGSGGGSFYSTFPSYQSKEVGMFYDNAHNDYLQFAIEQGFPALACLAYVVLFCAYCSLKAMWQRQSVFFRGMAFISLMGILSLMIHSLVDFNLQIPSNASYFMVVLAIGVLSRYLRTNTKQELRGQMHRPQADII